MKPAKTAITTTRVIVRGEYKKRRKGQLALFAAERILVERFYDEDGRFIGANLTPLGHEGTKR